VLPEQRRREAIARASSLTARNVGLEQQLRLHRIRHRTMWALVSFMTLVAVYDTCLLLR
jgi:hypothetical protein